MVDGDAGDDQQAARVVTLKQHLVASRFGCFCGDVLLEATIEVEEPRVITDINMTLIH